MTAKKRLDPTYGSDEWLRSFRFRIHSRPKTGPVLWQSKGGAVLTQKQALGRCKIESVKKGDE